MHNRSTSGRTRLLVRVGAPLAIAAAAGLVMPAAAFAKGGKPQGSAGATCSVNPSSVAAGSTYTISASGLPAGAFVNIMVSDSAGTSAYSAQVDSNGAASATGRSYTRGNDTVTVQQYDGRQTTVFATCNFTVI